MDDDEPKAGNSREIENKTSDSETGTRSSRSVSSEEVKEPVELTSAARLGTKKMQRKTKRKEQRSGRVVKPRVSRRAKRKTKPRAQRPRHPSTSTIYVRRHSSSPFRKSTVQICKHCGHRCCMRRYYEKRQRIAKRKKNARKPASQNETASAEAQAGSRCSLLSPLFVRSNAIEPQEQSEDYCEISPEMIHQALRELTMWRQGVPTEMIFDYIRYNYPVHPNPEEVMAELLEKLYIASIAGLVCATPNQTWQLAAALDRINKLHQSHVTIFWKVYADTLKPLDINMLRRNEMEANTSDKPDQTGHSDIV